MIFFEIFSAINRVSNYPNLVTEKPQICAYLNEKDSCLRSPGSSSPPSSGDMNFGLTSMSSEKSSAIEPLLCSSMADCGGGGPKKGRVG